MATVRKNAGAKPRGAVYRAPALEKGIAILELLVDASRPLAMAEIAGALRRSPPEIYRMLAVLETLGYIHRADENRYDLTAKLFEVASRHSPKRSVVAAARVAMEELAETTSQSNHLMVNSGDHMICVAREESPAAIGFAVQVGFRLAMVDSTSGRVFFAFQDAHRQELLLARIRRGRPAPAAERAFRTGLRTIATRGYALEPSRLTTGIRDISAPVFGAERGRAIACLTVPFVSHRLFSTTLDDTRAALVAATQRISRALVEGVSAQDRDAG